MKDAEKFLSVSIILRGYLNCLDALCNMKCITSLFLIIESQTFLPSGTKMISTIILKRCVPLRNGVRKQMVAERFRNAKRRTESENRRLCGHARPRFVRGNERSVS